MKPLKMSNIVRYDKPGIGRDRKFQNHFIAGIAQAWTP